MNLTKIVFVAALLWSMALGAEAHDSSAWGGLFRSRDFGASWLPADPGLYIGGALAVAVHPRDPARLLYGTDTRFLVSQNGGRDWADVGETEIPASVFAVSYDAQGATALAATAASLYRTVDLRHWKEISLPSGAAPLRDFVLGQVARRIYVASSRGVLRSDDAGETWNIASEQLQDASVASLVATAKSPQLLYAIIGGQVWTSDNEARSWRQQSAGIPASGAQALTVAAGRVWLVAADQVFALNPDGNWLTRGRPLPERDTSVRAIAVSDDARTIVLSTHRGVYRSEDMGQGWQLIEGNLPVHLESGLLIRDPHDAATLYTGFAMQTYDELWRRANRGSTLLSELSMTSLAGAAAFLALLLGVGVLLVRWLQGVATERK
jgi:photosystem II stability/assembly factor-like uncharacterized protein